MSADTITTERAADTGYDVIDSGFSRAIVMTSAGSVVAREAALAEAAATLVLDLFDTHRPTPADLLAALELPLDDDEVERPVAAA